MNSKRLLLTLALVSFFGSALADVRIYYVNGIFNTRAEVKKNAQEIASKLNASTNRTGLDKVTFQAKYIYNPIGFAGTSSGCGLPLCQDKKELFIEKTSEEHYSGDFRRILSPHNSSTVLDRVAATAIKVQYFNDLTPGNNSLETNGGISDANMESTRQVLDRIVSVLRSTEKKIFVAHSQGNLLINLAWAAYVSEAGQPAGDRVRFVNVANTSLFSINGLNLTHAKDAALFSAATDTFDKDLSLETLPSLFGIWNRTTPRCSNSACNFTLAVPTFGGVDGLPGVLDHEFLKGYLSAVQLPIVVDPQGITFTPGKTSFIDRFEDLVYAAAKSLDIVGGETATSVVYAKTQTDENIQYGAVTDFYQYYFLGYQSLANPPAQPNYWTVTRAFDTVRMKKTGGTATCSQISGNSTLFDNTGNSVASLVGGYPDGDYCVFTTYRGGANAAAIPVGTRVAGIAISPTAGSGSFTLAGSSQNGGRSVNGYNSADRAGGLAFQFCSGTCDRPF